MFTNDAAGGSRQNSSNTTLGTGPTMPDFHMSRQQMTLFGNNQEGKELRSAFSPDTAVTDDTWDDITPPPYDLAVAGNGRSLAQDVTIVRTPQLLSPGKRKSSKVTPKSYSRPFRPGIKVNTAVSRHHGSAPQQLFPSRGASKAGSGAGGWVRKMSQLRRSRGSTATKRDATVGGTPGRAVSTKHREAVDEVTPSDRVIPIALMATSPLHFDTLMVPQAAQHPADTAPPTISITPAQESTEWSPNPASYARIDQSRPRPPSSVYSRATNWMTPMMPAAGDTPPMPAIPSHFYQAHTVHELHKSDNGPKKDESQFTTLEEDAKYREQTMSAGTVFEEDQTPASAGAYMQRFARKPRELAIDTTATTPRRSRGWWNVILTPFDLSRSGSRLFRSPTSAQSYTPNVPDIAEAVKRYNLEHCPDTPVASGHNAPVVTANTVQPATSETARDVALAPHRRDPSQESMFSPNDRDVPLVLDSGPHHTTPSRGVPQSNTPTLARLEMNTRAPNNESKQRYQSPSSIRSESPVVQTAALGLVAAARSVQHSPHPAGSSTMHDTGLKNPFSDLPLRQHTEHAPPMRQAAYVPHAQYAKTLSYAGPVTTFGSFNEKTPAHTAPPPALINVKSVWEPEPSPQKGFMKRSKHTEKGGDGKKKKKRRCLLCCICLGLLFIIIFIVVLALALSRRHGGSATSGSTGITGGSSSSNSGNPKSGGSPTATQTQTISFVNLTGLPAMPTGQLTIAQPTLLAQVNGCTDPTTLWSCDLPKEAQEANKPAGPSEPNFRMVIAYNNDTGAGPSSRMKRDLGGSPFTPNPSPPTEQDQIFLGNTTEHNAEPFQGEDTPFFISFISPTDDSSTSDKIKRDATRTTTVTSGTATANFVTSIPSPAINNDGTAASANLLPSPLPSNQPLKLYNRGRSDEHYGFYTYFDRSIFLRSVSVSNISSINPGQIPADQDGGAEESAANARCTWTQTRFLVQIWTKTPASLLSGSNGSGAPANSSVSNDLIQPGSFPYPVTITTDRHGGTPAGKMIYCYALDQQERPIPLNKTLYFETRGFQGTLINPQQAFQSLQVDPSEPASKGGIDGGTGGCGCRWGNWDDTRGF